MTPGPADEARRALREARERAARERAEGGSGASAAGSAGPPAAERGRGGPAPEETGATDRSAEAAKPTPDASDTAPTARIDTDAAEDHRVGVAPPPPGARDTAPTARIDTDAAEDHRVGVAPPTPGARDTAPTVTTAEAAPTHPDTDNLAEAAKPTPDTRDSAHPADAAREALREARRRRADAEAAEAEAALGRRRSRGAGPTVSRVRDRSRAPGSTAAVRARDVRELLADAFRMPEDETQAEEEHQDNSPTRQGSSPQEAGTAAPRHPQSMAAPTRDNDLRRTFPAFPPRASEDARFAATWWGNAWVTALEEGALDVKRLARGRGYAEQGHVDAITVTPGLVLAYVRGSRARPYRVQVRLRTLADADWDRFLDLAADRTGHIAALLDKEMPQALAECGVPLLPGPGDLEPQCSCPDRGHPCKHAAALCYQTARLLDADPFVLLLLRGRGERELLDALSRLSAARAARAAQGREPAPLPGVRAAEALAPRRLPPLPAPLPVPPHPEQPPAYPASPGGPDPFALDQLATDAAARAHALLATGRDPVGELTLWQDAVRLAAARPGSGLTAGTRSLYASLAAATDRTTADLARAVAAWRQGGLEGLAVLEEPWDPPAGRFDRARPLLLAADLPAFRPWRNHLTHPRAHLQLRLGRDGLWYAYESEPGHDDWWPRGTPDPDPVGALTGLGTPTDL
ncbi:SWIM zinc finger family protein [Streptomyces sp. WSLK1-5]|uniref:SWIM zinc finger family protein n=1 Tax=unclassified Streptomyces TaxID=2593676 RepID=UPI0037B8BC29